MPGLVRLDLAVAAHPAGSLVDPAQRVRALVRVHPDHHHMHRPFIWLTADEADLRRTDLCQGTLPGSYQVTPVNPSGGDGRHNG